MDVYAKRLIELAEAGNEPGGSENGYHEWANALRLNVPGEEFERQVTAKCSSL
jgi:hypothetical protein